MPDVPRVVVHTPSDKSTVAYTRYMWEAMRSLANHPDDMELVIHSIGPTAGARLSDMPGNVSYKVCHSLQSDKNLEGSWGHACCIMQALSMMADGNLHVICDSDTVVAARGWDDYLRHRIVLQGLGVIGTTYEDIGGFSSGTTDMQTYKRIPTFTFAAFHPKHDWRQLDVRPEKTQAIAVTNETMSRVYNLPIGSRVFKEAGWQVPQYLADHGISYDGWTHHKPTKHAVVLKGLNDYHEEYHAEGIPFVTHQRGSLRHAFREDRISKQFYTTLDGWIAAERDRAPRWTWDDTEDNRRACAALQLEGTHKPQQSLYESLQTRLQESMKPQPTPPPVLPPGASPTMTAASAVASISGWLKATLDGKVAWSRHVSPVPRFVDVNFEHSDHCRHLRLEGTVTEAGIALPGAMAKPYLLAVRNMTMGPVTCKAYVGDKRVELPADKCWMLTVDVDGVVHVE